MAAREAVSDLVAALALVLSATLLCLVVYQGMTIDAAQEALMYLREHCIIRP